MSPAPLTRRTFLKSTSRASVAAIAFPYVMRSQEGQSPNNKLNVACIGVGGRGAAAVAAMKDENIVALCDVDEARGAKSFAQYPDVPRFRDFRELFDKKGNAIDAVTVS